MPDYERFNHQDPVPNNTHSINSSVRILIQALTLSAVLWVAKSLNEQNVSITQLQVQITDLKENLSGVPSMKDRLTVLEQRQNFLLDNLPAMTASPPRASAKKRPGGFL